MKNKALCGYRVPPTVFISVCDLVLDSKTLLSMKFGVGVLHQNLSSKDKLRENRFSDTYCMLKGVRDLLHVMPS